MSRRFPFTAVDELGRLYERESEPNNVQFELVVPGRLDMDRVRAAVALALATHPIARVRRVGAGLTGRSIWEVADRPDVDPVSEARGVVAAERETLFARRIPLASSPLLRVHVVHDPDGTDTLMLCTHHAIFDGMASVRMMRSIAAHYSEEPDPVPEVDPFSIRTVEVSKSGPGQASRRWAPTDRIAANTAASGPGYGFATVVLSPDQTATLAGLRAGATVNDLLLAAAFQAIAAWNLAHGRSAGRIRITMPLNARPRRLRNELIGNLSRLTTITTDPADRTDPRTLISAVVAQTNVAKASKASPAGWSGSLLGSALLPYPVRKAMLAPSRVAARTLADTTMVSNIGLVARSFRFGVLGEAVGAFASPPAPMPRGLSVGVVTVAGRLHLCIRHRFALLDRVAAEAFATGLVRAVDGIAGYLGGDRPTSVGSQV